MLVRRSVISYFILEQIFVKYTAVMSTAQPPGVPEICKKSLSACTCMGGMELFILGKNFLKDTRVVFQHGDALSDTSWEESVQPDKEFLQQACGLSR
jgi:nuclear factor of activated T-cells 5